MQTAPEHQRGTAPMRDLFIRLGKLTQARERTDQTPMAGRAFEAVCSARVNSRYLPLQREHTDGQLRLMRWSASPEAG